MRLQSVRDLKLELLEAVVEPAMDVSTRATARARTLAERSLTVAVGAGGLGGSDLSVGVAASSFESLPPVSRSVALGVSKRGQQHQLAIRIQRQALAKSPLVEHLIKRAKGEANVRVIGRIEKRTQLLRTRRAGGPSGATNWQRGRIRPLQMGTSIAHVNVTAGTLGCFVRRGGNRFILSNNHVLADEDNASIGDDILQRSRLDGGQVPGDVVGELREWIKLRPRASNRVDAAIATIADGVDVEPNLLQGLVKGKDRRLAGVGADFLDEGTIVYKLGRTTGATIGRITAFEVDNVVIQYDRGQLRYDGQIEIEGNSDRAFSAGGDSGSIIVDADGKALALLFAGGDTGGSNGLGLTYANPIQTVLTDLDVELEY